MAGGLMSELMPVGQRPEDLRIAPEMMREWLECEFYKAFREARAGKRGTEDEHRFELNAMENISMLTDDVMERVYAPSRGIAFVVKDPVIREIFAAPFRDRIIHHFLFNMVAAWWDARFIYDSYSCRKGKGTLFGIMRLAKQIQQKSENYTRETYVAKYDILGYFMSMSREKIFERLRWGLDQQFKDGGLVKDVTEYLWREVVFDNPIDGVAKRGDMALWDKLPESKSLFHQPPGKGMVIGNLSSQLVSNIYLDQLDRFMKFDLGYDCYGRYVDDFYVVVTKEELPQLMRDIRAIEDFLLSLELTLHPRKRMIQPIGKGIPFLGAVVYPEHILAGKRLRANIRNELRLIASGRKLDLTALTSYFGHLSHMDAEKLKKKMFEEVGWEYEW